MWEWIEPIGGRMQLQRLIKVSVRWMSGVALLAIASCSETTAPPLSDLSGVWSILGRSGQASCSPSPLPAPIESDTNLYVQLPPPSESLTGQFRLSQNGGELAMTRIDAQGHPQSEFTLTGSIDTWGGSSQSSGSWPLRVEGPREGGHLFQVSESVVDKSHFFRDVLLPNGALGNAGRMSTINRTFVFRDGGASGPVFTTCLVADTVSGRLLSR